MCLCAFVRTHACLYIHVLTYIFMQAYQFLNVHIHTHLFLNNNNFICFKNIVLKHHSREVAFLMCSGMLFPTFAPLFANVR